jgi:hydrogenase 3 maturation protease
MTDLRDNLRERLKGRVLLVGIGNSMRGDDGIGPKIIQLLDGKVKAELMDVGEVPESYTDRIIAVQADTIVLIDAADFGATPGDLAIMDPKDFTGCAVSTHRMPLLVFFRYLQANTHADMFALGIQAAEIGLGESMSPAVARSVQFLAEFLEEVLA